MKDKVKALLDIGMAEEQIMSILGLTEDEYLNALYETEESVEEAPEENEEKVEKEHDRALPELEEYSGKSKGKGKMSEEEFNLVKELRGKGYYNREISKHLGRSEGFIQQVTSNCETYEDLEKYRTKIREHQCKLYDKNQGSLSAQRRAERKKEYEETKEAEKEEQPKSARHVVDEELFKQVKEIQANGGGLAYTAEVTGFSQSRISRIRGCKTFEEYKQKGQEDLVKLKANYQSNKSRPINKTLAAVEDITLTLKEIRDQLTRIADYQEPKKRGWFNK